MQLKNARLIVTACLTAPLWAYAQGRPDAPELPPQEQFNLFL